MVWNYNDIVEQAKQIDCFKYFSEARKNGVYVELSIKEPEEPTKETLEEIEKRKRIAETIRRFCSK